MCWQVPLCSLLGFTANVQHWQMASLSQALSLVNSISAATHIYPHLAYCTKQLAPHRGTGRNSGRGGVDATHHTPHHLLSCTPSPPLNATHPRTNRGEWAKHFMGHNQNYVPLRPNTFPGISCSFHCYCS